jgi:hypothetical protein
MFDHIKHVIDGFIYIYIYIYTDVHNEQKINIIGLKYILDGSQKQYLTGICLVILHTLICGSMEIGNPKFLLTTLKSKISKWGYFSTNTNVGPNFIAGGCTPEKGQQLKPLH